MNNIDINLYPQYNFKFDGVKNTFDNYTLGKDEKGNLVAISKKDNSICIDQLIIDRVKFSIAWAKSTQYAHSRSTPYPEFNERDYEYAFNQGARETYAVMMGCVNKQLLTTGNIDLLEIINEVKKISYKYSEGYVKNLFSKKIYVEALDKWSRHAIPNALPSTQPLMTLEELQSLESNNTHKMY